MKLFLIFAVLGMSSSQAATVRSHAELVASTPCLAEYRTWRFDDWKTRAKEFKAPDSFTIEQCEAAKVVDARIDQEQLEDDAIRKAQEQDFWDAEEKARKAKIAARKAQEAKPGARLGMTKSQVINKTNWGEPESVNRTITTHGTREQWVYGDGNYLYFTNGLLTAIQN